MRKKSIWSRITGLKEEELEKEKEEIEVAEEEKKEKVVEVKKEEKKKEMESEEDWLKDEYEAQLSVDVYQDKKNIFVRSVIGGIEREDLKIEIEEDIVTIRGQRKMEEETPKEYLHQECYWGKFSRTILLPSEIKPEKAKIKFKNGILTITLPKK